MPNNRAKWRTAANDWLLKSSLLIPLAIAPVMSQAQDAAANLDIKREIDVGMARNAEHRAIQFSNGDNSAVAQYPAFSPFGINGAYYYGKLTFKF